METTWFHEFTCMISGPTGCGKTVWVKKFIDNLTEMMAPTPEEIIWCYGEYQPIFNDIKGVEFVEGIPKIENWEVGKRRLVIIDDLMNETDENVSKIFSRGSHHRSMSVFYIVQNLFNKNKEHRTISLNCHYMVIFKNPRDSGQIAQLGRQMYPGKVKYVQEAFKDATARSYGYLLFDLRQTTPDHLRLRTNIFPGERHTVYIQK